MMLPVMVCSISVGTVSLLPAMDFMDTAILSPFLYANIVAGLDLFPSGVPVISRVALPYTLLPLNLVLRSLSVDNGNSLFTDDTDAVSNMGSKVDSGMLRFIDISAELAAVDVMLNLKAMMIFLPTLLAIQYELDG